jgi:hypothetical protein
MSNAHEESFVVFLRDVRCDPGGGPEVVERPLVACPTYAEARRAWREWRRPARACVIRYVGPSGGGD